MNIGFKELDAITGGLHNGDLIVVASRPGMGKTSFVLNIASNVVRKDNAPIAIFSLGMPKEQILNKLKLREKEITDLLYINDTPVISTAEIKSICRNLKLEKNIELIIIDYIQLIKASEENTSIEQNIAEISKSLKILSKELDAPVIAVSQLSTKHRPMMTDFNKSRAVAQVADIVMLLYKENVKDIENTEIIIAKNRYGKYSTIKLKDSFK